MLNNIRGILNRRNDPSKSPESLLPRTSSEDNDDSTGSNEGFLCPTCFRSFPSDIALQDHYETTHLESEISGDRRGTLSCPACKMKLGTESELNSHYARHHSSPKDQEEIEAMSLQVKALEEGKALLQGELKAFRLQASELSRENALIREERDSFKLKANKLTDDLANLKLDFDELKVRKESIESSLQTSEDKVKKLLVEIQQRPEADDVNVLQKELVSVQKIMNDLTHQREVEKEMLEKQCNSVQETCKKLQAEKLELENTMKSFPRKEEVLSLQNKVKEMTKNINETQKQLQKISGEKKALEEKLQKCSNYDEIKSLLSTKENTLEETIRISSEKDVLIAKLNSELKTTKESIEEMKTGRDKLFSKIQEGEGASAAMIELKEENVRLQDRFVLQQEMHVEAMNEADTKIEELRSNLKKTTTLLKESNEKYEELEKSLTQSKNQIQELIHQKDDLLKEINAQTETLNETESTFKQQIDELTMELSNRTLSLEEKNLQIENLKNQLKKEKSSFEKTCEKLELEKQSFEKRLSELGDTLPSVQADLLDKTNKLMDAEKKLQQLSEKLKSKEKEGTDKQDELNQLYLLYEGATSKIEKLEKAAADFETDKTEFLEKISSLNEDLLKSKMKETELVDDVERMNKNQIQIQEKSLSLEEENKNLRTSITTLQNEKNSLLSEIEEGKKALEDLTDINNAHIKQLKELNDMCKKEKANAEKVLQDASVEKEVYIKDKMKLQKQIENLENDRAKQLSQFQETVKKLEGQIKEGDEKIAALKSSLEEYQESLKSKEREWEGKEAHHTAQVGLLTENIQTLRDDLSSEQKLKESFKLKLDEISGTKLELEAKLDNALDERRGLLERCLKSETECERLQKSASEMRRKYDDCVAALQELGRENQTLQVENMKHITRKWADDSEVTNCTACGKMFSVTIRKHHCRNCGSIFCNECSAKSATVAASKKPVRVCDICYLEVTK